MTRILVEQVVPGVPVTVVGDERHYLSSVRRHRPGDELELQDAQGHIYRARLEAIDAQGASLIPTERVGGLRAPHPVRILFAVPKGRAFDDVVRALSELGVERLTPIVCARSVVDPGDNKVERWRRIASESIRQCARSTPMEVDFPTPVDEALSQAEGARFLLHPGGPAAGGVVARREGAVTVAVGPEGGFTGAEVAAAEAAGFAAVGFGPFVLRMETAAVAAGVFAVTVCGGLD